MRKPSIAGPMALGAAAGLLAAVVGDVTTLAVAGVLGLSILGTALDQRPVTRSAGGRRARATARRTAGRR